MPMEDMGARILQIQTLEHVGGESLRVPVRLMSIAGTRAGEMGDQDRFPYCRCL